MNLGMALDCTPVYTARDLLQSGTPDVEILVELVEVSDWVSVMHARRCARPTY